MSFEVFIKIGRNFVGRGEVVASDSQKAAEEAAFLLNAKTIGVRPAHSDITPVVHKFKTVPIPA